MLRLSMIMVRLAGIVGVCGGGLLINDGLLPMRSHGPNPSWAEVRLGVCVTCVGVALWAASSTVLRRLRVRSQKHDGTAV